jgi:hypothetical protein
MHTQIKILEHYHADPLYLGIIPENGSGWAAPKIATRTSRIRGFSEFGSNANTQTVTPTGS